MNIHADCNMITLKITEEEARTIRNAIDFVAQDQAYMADQHAWDEEEVDNYLANADKHRVLYDKVEKQMKEQGL